MHPGAKIKGNNPVKEVYDVIYIGKFSRPKIKFKVKINENSALSLIRISWILCLAYLHIILNIHTKFEWKLEEVWSTNIFSSKTERFAKGQGKVKKI